MARQFGDGDGDVNPPSLALWRDYGHEMPPVEVPLLGYGSAPDELGAHPLVRALRGWGRSR